MLNPQGQLDQLKMYVARAIPKPGEVTDPALAKRRFDHAKGLADNICLNFEKNKKVQQEAKQELNRLAAALGIMAAPPIPPPEDYPEGPATSAPDYGRSLAMDAVDECQRLLDQRPPITDKRLDDAYAKAFSAYESAEKNKTATPDEISQIAIRLTDLHSAINRHRVAFAPLPLPPGLPDNSLPALIRECEAMLEKGAPASAVWDKYSLAIDKHKQWSDGLINQEENDKLIVSLTTLHGKIQARQNAEALSSSDKSIGSGPGRRPARRAPPPPKKQAQTTRVTPIGRSPR